MPSANFPLVGSYTNRGNATTTTDDQVFTNCFAELNKNPVIGKGSAKLIKRPGYSKGSSLSGVLQACASGGIVSWSGSASTTPPIAAAFLNTDTTKTSVWNLKTDIQIGSDITATAECTSLTETTISGTPNLVGNFIDSSTGAVEQWYFPEGGAWTQVTDGDFPSDITGFPAHMDGFVFNMTSSGKIYNSDVNSVSAYTANSFVPASAYPDKGVTVAKLGSFIMGFGEKSIEQFVNNGNASGSPLTRVDGGAIHMGACRRTAAGLQTVLTAHGTIYWIGTNSDGGVTGIYRFKGSVPDKISNVGIDSLLQTAQITGFVGSMVLQGMSHIVLRGTSGVWCYCLDTNFWWKHLLQSGELRACIGVNTATNPFGLTYFIGTNNARANFHTLNQDDGSNYTQTVTTESMSLGTQRRKFYGRLLVDYDKQSATSNLGIAYSDDGGSTFSTARNIDMSQIAKPFITRLGSSIRRIWQLTNTANTPSGIKAVELEYDVGQN